MERQRTLESIVATREAEASLLGAILIEASVRGSTALEEVGKVVKVGDFLDARFYDNQHARIYSAMVSCNEPPNQIVVAQEMANQGTLRKGDCAYLRHLVAEVPCSLDYMYYAKTVADYALKRRLEYHSRKGNYDKVKSLLQKNKPRFTGGITP